jgi:hypothetical protein
MEIPSCSTEDDQDRNETPQSAATTLGGRNSEDQTINGKDKVDDHAIEATIARYNSAADPVRTNTQKSNRLGHSPLRPIPSLNGSADPTGSGRDIEEWRSRHLIEQAAIASIAQLSQKLIASETCLHETMNARWCNFFRGICFFLNSTHIM